MLDFYRFLGCKFQWFEQRLSNLEVIHVLPIDMPVEKYAYHLVVVSNISDLTLWKNWYGKSSDVLWIHRNGWGNWIGFYSTSDVSWSETPKLKFGWFRNKRNLSVFPFLKVCFWKCDFDDMASIMTSFFGRKNGNEWWERDLNNNYLREIQKVFHPYQLNDLHHHRSEQWFHCVRIP